MSKKPDPKQLAAQRENLDRIIELHVEYLAKIPSLGFSEEVEDRMIRAGEAYVAELRKERRAIA